MDEKRLCAFGGMDLDNGHDFPISQISSNENEDPLPSQSSYMSNVFHFNPQTPIPPLSSSILNYPTQITPPNQLQMNYGFHPTNFTHHLGQQLSFQSMMKAPLSFDNQISTSSKNKGRKRKNTSNNISKEFEHNQLNRRHWTKEEDVALTKAYLHISIDAIVGKDQSSDKMWKRIHLKWKEFLVNAFVEDRPINGLSKRWCTIQGAVNKFHGIYEFHERSPSSGTNLDDLKKKAHRLYKEADEENKPFAFEHCWVECKKNAKWCTQQLTTNCSKRQKTNDDSPTTSIPSISTIPSAIHDGGEPIDVETPSREFIDGDGIIRPPGRNRSKEKKKIQCQDKAVAAEVLSKLQVSLQQQFDHNEKELELKREIAKKELEIKERELAIKEKAQRQRDQQKLLNQDLSKLNPMVRIAMEKIQEKILKEWEEEGYF